jgi:hypothetical protein
VDIQAAIKRIETLYPHGEMQTQSKLAGETFLCRKETRWFTTASAVEARHTDFAVAFPPSVSYLETLENRATRVCAAERSEDPSDVFGAYENILALWKKHAEAQLQGTAIASETVERLHTALCRCRPAESMVLATAAKVRLINAGLDVAAFGPLLDSISTFVKYGWLG